jgi:hypothetical protein
MLEYEVFSESFFEELVEEHPQLMLRAAKSAAFGWVMPEIKAAISEAFDRPTPYTLNSTKFEITSTNPPIITIYLRQPDRMGRHYLTAQVEGGERAAKGFERALGIGYLMPASGAKLNKYGNISPGQLRQILSVLGNKGAGGYSFALTSKSSKRNKKQRDYFQVPDGDDPGLHPGIWRRKAIGKAVKTGTHRAGQRGKRGGVVRARGVQPVLMSYSDPTDYRQRLNFYDYAVDSFRDGFAAEYNTLLAGI